ncbi:Cell division topological specificity factor [Buchnera aphidicola (Eriosoma lanigerum)]|uniref:cell division topological specificity factor MinE n=1 Tax=Buchnera aphidicola TaxID=9 RepID=UPI003464B2E9
MPLLSFFISNNKQTANVAKQRLQIIIAKNRKINNYEPDYFPMLKNEILLVLSKYINIHPNMIKIHLEQKKKNISILELNIILPK